MGWKKYEEGGAVGYDEVATIEEINKIMEGESPVSLGGASTRGYRGRKHPMMEILNLIKGDSNNQNAHSSIDSLIDDTGGYNTMHIIELLGKELGRKHTLRSPISEIVEMLGPHIGGQPSAEIKKWQQSLYKGGERPQYLSDRLSDMPREGGGTQLQALETVLNELIP